MSIPTDDGWSTPRALRQTILTAQETPIKDTDASDLDRDRLSSLIRCQLIGHSGEPGHLFIDSGKEEANKMINIAKSYKQNAEHGIAREEYNL